MMRIALVAALLFLTPALFAEEWIEFTPPMMDDVTIDPLRFIQHGESFDLANPAFRPIEHGQSAKATRSDKTSKDKLVIDCEFVGREGLEYLEVQTNIKIDKPGLHLGGAFAADFPRSSGTIRVRLRDPSGETHQHTLGVSNGTMIFAPIVSSTEGSWGGDGDKTLQFPCEIASFILDRPGAGFVGKGTLEITELALFEEIELRDVLKIEFAADSPAGLLFENENETLIFRLTPKNLNEGEVVYYVFDHRSAPGGFPAGRETERRPPSPMQLSGAADAVHRIQIGQNYPGAVRVVITGYVQNADGERVNILPVSFSYGSIVPNTPQDARLGVCTHYQQGWNTNSMDFAVKAGFGMIRDEMTWSNVERQKGVLALPPYAPYIDLACSKGLEPLLLLNYSNWFYDDNGFPASDEAVAGFANYCRFIAENFKGRIKYYEIWNEWFIGCGMTHVKDSGQNTPENYVKLIKSAYAAVKEADPDAYVVGGGGDHPAYHRKQIEELFKLGVHNYCDAFSIHPYRQPRTPEGSRLVEEVLGFAEMMRQYGVEQPKLWITEIGWPTPKKHPAKDAELFQAAMVVRSAVPLLALDVVEKFIWYDLKNDGTDRVDQEHNFGLIRHDRLGLQVKPAFIAFSVMSGNTSGRNIAKDERLSQDGVYAYRLSKEGEPDRLVLWIAEGERQIMVPAITSATNMFGTPLRLRGRSVTLTDAPIWVVLR